MELEVKLEAFEGPLDLLLHLIEKNKVDISSPKSENTFTLSPKIYQSLKLQNNIWIM